MLGSVEMAEDITHDCFLSLINKPQNFNPERASLRTYLYSAARNLALKHFRNTSREAPLDEVDDNRAISSREQPMQRLLDKELALVVKDAVCDLPPLQREALVLFEYEGLALSDIANVVEADVGTVKGRLFRARARLRSRLRPYLNSSREIVTLERA
jgi:RNA polymerase sigma factor (sigma-70 family)